MERKYCISMVKCPYNSAYCCIYCPRTKDCEYFAIQCRPSDAKICDRRVSWNEMVLTKLLQGEKG